MAVSVEYDQKRKNKYDTDVHWWLTSVDQGNSKESKIYEDIWSCATNQRNLQTLRLDQNLRNMRLYGNMSYNGITIESYTSTQDHLGTQNRLALNIVKSMVDTITNKIAKNKPLPTFLTDGAPFDQKQKAQKMQKWITGHIEANNLYEKGQSLVRDGGVLGTGLWKVYSHGKEICFDRTFCFELFVNDIEAFYGAPQTLYQIKQYPKAHLKNMYPEYESYIEDAMFSTSQSRTMNDSDQVTVIEAWRLAHKSPSGEVVPGKHAIVLSNCTILYEDYKRLKFPFVKYNFSDPLLGYWGTSLSDDLVGMQIEINKILRTIQKAIHLCSVPRVYMENNSGVISQHFTNEVGAIIKYIGERPFIDASNSVPPELFSHLDRLVQQAYQIAGVSELSAQAKKPFGLDSGKALRTYNDIETQRHVILGLKYEEAFIDASEQILDLSKEIAEEYKDFGVMTIGKNSSEVIKWSDVNSKEDMYSIRVFPTSALSEYPAQRLEEVKELAETGFATKEMAAKLLDFPDLEGFYSEITAPLEMIEWVADSILEGKDYIPPEPFMNLNMGIQVMSQKYMRARIDGAPDEILDNMRLWIVSAQDMLSKATQAALPPAPQQIPQVGPAQVPPQAAGI